jgi:hypothetical protein
VRAAVKRSYGAAESLLSIASSDTLVIILRPDQNAWAGRDEFPVDLRMEIS